MGFDHEQFLNEIKNKDIDELRLNITRQIYQYPKSDLVKYELERRERKDQQFRFSEMLNVTERNASSTANLVKATWALAIVTTILALITIFNQR